MAKITSTIYAIGDRVQVKYGKEHDPMSKEKKGTIVAITTPGLGIKFDGMSKIHKWYTDDELEAE